MLLATRMFPQGTRKPKWLKKKQGGRLGIGLAAWQFGCGRRNMLPTLSGDDLVDGPPMKSELFAKGIQSRSSLRVLLANFYNHLRCQFELASGSFHYRINDVIRGRPKEKVIWVNTSLDIPAGAVVADIHALGDVSAKQFPCGAMGLNSFAIYSDLPVSVTKGASPNPTRVVSHLHPHLFHESLVWMTTAVSNKAASRAKSNRSSLVSSLTTHKWLTAFITVEVNRQIPLLTNKPAQAFILLQGTS